MSVLSPKPPLSHKLYLKNHHSSQEHAINGTSCLLAFLSPKTCHLSNLQPRSTTAFFPRLDKSCHVLSVLSPKPPLSHKLYLKNHHSSQEHAINGTSCLLAFLSPKTCHLSNLQPRSTTAFFPRLDKSCHVLSVLSPKPPLSHKLYLKNHHSSQEHAINGTSCLLAFLSPKTCHLSNLQPRSTTAFFPRLDKSCHVLSVLSPKPPLSHKLYLKNHHSSQEHAINGTSCLLAFLSPKTCHLSNLRSINLI